MSHLAHQGPRRQSAGDGQEYVDLRPRLLLEIGPSEIVLGVLLTSRGAANVPPDSMEHGVFPKQAMRARSSLRVIPRFHPIARARRHATPGWGPAGSSSVVQKGRMHLRGILSKELEQPAADSQTRGIVVHMMKPCVYSPSPSETTAFFNYSLPDKSENRDCKYSDIHEWESTVDYHRVLSEAL